MSYQGLKFSLNSYRISSNSFRTCMYCDQRSQYIRSMSKKNSFRGNYMRKYGIQTKQIQDTIVWPFKPRHGPCPSSCKFFDNTEAPIFQTFDQSQWSFAWLCILIGWTYGSGALEKLTWSRLLLHTFAHLTGPSFRVTAQ